MRTSDWLLLALLSVMWGTTYFFIAVASPQVPPFTLVLGRVGFAAMALIPLVYLTGLRLPATVAGWWPFVVQAMINNVIPFVLMVYGQLRIASGLAAVLNATTPLFTLMVARFFAGDALTPAKLAGVLIGVLGVGVLVGPEAMHSNASTVIGMLCILGAALSYAVSALWMRRLRQIPPLVSSAAQLTCSTLTLLPLAGALERFWLLPAPDGPAVLAVLALALFSTAAAYLVFFRLNATAGPTNVMLVTLLIPVTATFLGVLLLNEALTWHEVAGATVIASGLVVIDGRLVARLAHRSKEDGLKRRASEQSHPTSHPGAKASSHRSAARDRRRTEPAIRSRRD
ncbi:MAG TPA: DMT family transporter [Hyphomicrobiaceae bacterium]|nr:DMT family transporter [Hyphomicrobiaceae bacterium]